MADAWIRQTENDAQWLLKPEARADFARVFLAGAQAGLALGKREGLELAAKSVKSFDRNGANAMCWMPGALQRAIRSLADSGARKPTATKGEL